MKMFEYEVTKHTAEEFQQLIVFCSKEGECALNAIPDVEARFVAGLLNERGRAGWELVQLVFGKGGLLAFWKHEISR